MKTYLVIPLVLAVTGSLLVTGGCVSKKLYDEAVAANRRQRGELEKALADQQAMRKEMEQVKSDLQGRDEIVLAKNKDISLLEKSKSDLQKAFDDLNDRYEKLLRGRKPPKWTINVLPAALNKALEAFAKENPGLIEYLPRYGMVKLKADLTFDKGSDVVGAEAKGVLEKFGTIMNSKDGSTFNVYVAGHTDDIPIRKAATRRRHPDNWYLSVHRAVAVLDVLLKARLGSARISAMGFGEYHPVAPNASGKRGNPLNRRVEIWIVPPNLFLTAAGLTAPPSK